MKRQIVIDITGGVIQSIGATKGLEDVEFIIKDYETEEDDFPKEVEEDEDGDEYYINRTKADYII